MDEEASAARPAARTALAVLVVLVVLSPWPFGRVHPLTTAAIAFVALATALGALVWDGSQGWLELPRLVVWPLIGLWLLALVQLLPLPASIHWLIAPGSAAVWHPGVPAAAAALGPGPHPVSLDPDATRRWLALTTGLVTLALAAAPALRERRSLLHATTGIVAGAALVATYGLAARLVFADKLYGLWTVPTVAPVGPFVNKNHFAGYVELAALLALGLAVGLSDEASRGSGWLSWIESRRAKWIVLCWGAVFLLVLAVPVSFSRGGVVSLVAGLLTFAGLRFWALSHSRLSARGLVAAIAAGAILLSTLSYVLPSEARARVLTLAGVTTEASGAYRLAVWRDTLRLVASSPGIGSGLGAYADALPRFKSGAGSFRIEHAENDYLELLAESGIAGGLLGALAALAVLALGVGGLRHEDSRLARALRMAALSGGVALGVHSLFDFNLRIPSNALLAVALLLYALPSRPHAGAPRQRLRARVVSGLIVMVGIVVGVLASWSEPAWDPRTLARASGREDRQLRHASLQATLVELLRERPAASLAWAQLAWLRHSASREEAAELARWGLGLDPQNLALQRATERLRLVAD